jgi:Protein of unknown function (DUF3754)
LSAHGLDNAIAGGLKSEAGRQCASAKMGRVHMAGRVSKGAFDAHGATAPSSAHGATAPSPAHGATAPSPAHGATTPSVANGLAGHAPPPIEDLREMFIPVTVNALIDRVTPAGAWGPGDGAAARRFFHFLEHWRRQRATADVTALSEAYEPFCPDSDLLVTREYSAAERLGQQKQVVKQIETLLQRANYVRINPENLSVIMTKESHYGLDLIVDFSAFEECLIYFRGKCTERQERRNPRKFYRNEEFDVPIYQRLFLLFKLKPFDVRVADIMRDKKLTKLEAERHVKKLRASLPGNVSDGFIYMKLFKNIPQTDIEMVFPTTRVQFRWFDKVKLGVTSGGAMGAGLFGTAGKIAAGGLAATNPVALAGAAVTLGGVAFRQTMNFVNQKNRYMVVMAQNLYFHAMADNRGVALKLADRAAEQEIKEDILLYSVLAKSQARREDLPEIDKAIENYLVTTFGVRVNFDLDDALSRLIGDGLVQEHPNGSLVALPPREAAAHVDQKWDQFLNDLPHLTGTSSGHEVSDATGPPPEATPML